MNRLGDRQVYFSNTDSIHYHNGLSHLLGRNNIKNSFHKFLHFLFAIISAPKENQSRGILACKSYQPGKVKICSYNNTALLTSQFNNFYIRSRGHSYLRDMDCLISLGMQPFSQRWRNRHINKEFHFTNSKVSSSAREAAYCKAASMSDSSRYGYALRIDSLVSPAANNPSRRDTGKRKFLMQGFPVQTAGSIVILSMCMANSFLKKKNNIQMLKSQESKFTMKIYLQRNEKEAACND